MKILNKSTFLHRLQQQHTTHTNIAIPTTQDGITMTKSSHHWLSLPLFDDWSSDPNGWTENEELSIVKLNLFELEHAWYKLFRIEIDVVKLLTVKIESTSIEPLVKLFIVKDWKLFG